MLLLASSCRNRLLLLSLFPLARTRLLLFTPLAFCRRRSRDFYLFRIRLLLLLLLFFYFFFLSRWLVIFFRSGSFTLIACRFLRPFIYI